MAAIPPEDSPAVSCKLYADVIVPRHLAGPFTYAVPQHLAPILRIGHRVEVPFGHSHIQGAVTALTHRPPQGMDQGRLKEIRALVADTRSPKISDTLFALAKRVADEYVAPWGQCLRLVMPPALPRSADSARFTLTPTGQAALATDESLSGDIRSILKRVSKRSAGIKKTTLAGGKGSIQRRQLENLLEKGWVVEVRRLPPAVEATDGPCRVESGDRGLDVSALPAVLREWEERLVSARAAGKSERVVVQASLDHRIACLCRAIHHIVSAGRSVLVITGEAERAEWMARTISRTERIAAVCFHSGLSDEGKAGIWEQAHQLQVIVGTRSAVFLPLTKLGMIWVEREEDPALKEPQEPRYHARDVARTRAQDEQALFVISSAHPLLETITVAERCGTLLRRTSAGPPPRIQVVDLRLQDRSSLLSPLLRQALGESIRHRTGALLFLNRKGYAGALICRDCGQVPRCQTCCVALTYYRESTRLVCAYCGTSVAAPVICTSCSSRHLQLVGEGTERVEDEVRRQFPHANVIRADGDTMRRPAQAVALWKRIMRRDWDVLIGTQLLLRDYAVPPAGLVGIVHADAGLNLPDFRAAERTYHQLLDAVGLARSESEGGQVILQTYLPSHHAIQSVVGRDEDIFRSEELAHRTVLGYPPAAHLIALHVSGADGKLVEKAADGWVAQLNKISVAATAAPAGTGGSKPKDRADRLTVLGPVPAPVPKRRGRIRVQILVKSEMREAGIRAVQATVGRLEQAYPARAVKFDVDVDPVEMW